jgi:hypothetical protein
LVRARGIVEPVNANSGHIRRDETNPDVITRHINPTGTMTAFPLG